MSAKFWCEFSDWSNNTSYWRAYDERPNWLCVAQADRMIMLDDKSQDYKVIKCRKSSINPTTIAHEEMQWIILQAQKSMASEGI